MRKLKLLGAATVVFVALNAIASTTASATLPELLPGDSGEMFNGMSGAGTLDSVAGIAGCTADSMTGETIGTTKKEALAEITLTGCEFGMHSLGDPEGTVSVHDQLKLCYINKANKEVGVLTKISPVHIEWIGKLLVWEGDQVGKITPVNTKSPKYTIEYKQSKDKPTPEGCEGERQHFTVAVNEGAPDGAGEVTIETITYDAEQTLDA